MSERGVDWAHVVFVPSDAAVVSSGVERSMFAWMISSIYVRVFFDPHGAPVRGCGWAALVCLWRRDSSFPSFFSRSSVLERDFNARLRIELDGWHSRFSLWHLRPTKCQYKASTFILASVKDTLNINKTRVSVSHLSQPAPSVRYMHLYFARKQLVQALP